MSQPFPTLIRKDTAPRFGHDGIAVRGYASPSRGSASVSAWHITLDPGASSPLHQLTHDEAFIALQGEAVIDIAGEELTVAAGDGVSVPPSTPFRIRNAGDQPFEAIACMSSSGKAWVGETEPFTPPWAV